MFVVEYEKLIEYGFKKQKGVYLFKKSIMDCQFELTIIVDSDGKIQDKLFDSASHEEYTLYKYNGATGTFVGQIKEEVEKIVQDIHDNCYKIEVFKLEQAKRVIKYIKDKYSDELEFLWEKFAGNAIVRRKDNKKWYAAILTVGKDKLGLKSTDIVEIIDLRGNPEEIENFVDDEKYFKGYHMNKKHWYTICLDNSLDDKTIFERIDISYQLAQKSR